LLRRDATKQQCIAIVKIAEAARVLGVEADAAAAIRSGVAASDFMTLVWSDVVADLLGDDPDPLIVDLIERARAG
jgi:hypothetical protein